MKKIKTYLITGLILVIILISCEKNDSNSIPRNLEYISYGTSFGECLGYCTRSITINDSSIKSEKKGWDLNGLLPVLIQYGQIDKSYWIELSKNIDFEYFFGLDSILGCPDCADGGSEWIEIKKDNETHKVVFEYKNEPNDFKNFIGILRTFQTVFDLDSSKTIDLKNIVLINQRGFIKNFVCSRGCYQFLIQSVIDNDIEYLYDKFLKEDFKEDNLAVYYCGVLLADSTMIFKPAPDDSPIPSFKVRNIHICDIKRIK